MSRLSLRPLFVVLAALGLVGCGGDTAFDEPVGAPATAVAGPASDVGEVGPVAPPAWLEVFADYPRYLHHKRRLAVVMTNRGATELVVSRIRLRADHFTLVPGEAKSARLAPGARVALQADFGAVDCDDARPLDAAVELEVARGDEPSPSALLVRLDPAPLDEIRDLECGQRRVADAVDIAFAPPGTVGDLQLSTDLVLTRRTGSEPVTLQAVRGSVLVSLTASEPTPLTMGSDEPQRRVPVVFSAIRCDPHAVGQATKPLDVTLFVAVGDDPPQYLAPALDDALANELRGLIARCVRARPPEG